MDILFAISTQVTFPSLIQAASDKFACYARASSVFSDAQSYT